MAKSHGQHENIACIFPSAQSVSELQPSAPINGSLREQLRQRLQPAMPAAINRPQPESLSPLIRFGEALLSDTTTPDDLQQCAESAFAQLNAIYERTPIPQRERRRRFIHATGLVMAPDHAIHTLKDVVRVRSFVRSLHAAIQKSTDNADGCLDVVYPACGPFAPLVLPLLAYYNHFHTPERKLTVTFIDIQPGAVQALNAIVDQLQLRTYVAAIHCLDAVTYKHPTPFDIVVLEALQHGFSREGHMQIAMHFAHQLKENGTLIPARIHISAALTQSQREFVSQWQHPRSTTASVTTDIGRISLGNILTLDKTFLTQLPPPDPFGSELLACGTIEIPRLRHAPATYVLIICTQIEVDDQHRIDEYASGITHPLPDLQVCVNFTPQDKRQGDLLVSEGDRVQFYYCMNGLPGFLPIKLPTAEAPAGFIGDIHHD